MKRIVFAAVMAVMAVGYVAAAHAQWIRHCETNCNASRTSCWTDCR
jgi:hypothetical protein